MDAEHTPEKNAVTYLVTLDAQSVAKQVQAHLLLNEGKQMTLKEVASMLIVRGGEGFGVFPRSFETGR